METSTKGAEGGGGGNFEDGKGKGRPRGAGGEDLACRSMQRCNIWQQWQAFVTQTCGRSTCARGLGIRRQGASRVQELTRSACARAWVLAD